LFFFHIIFFFRSFCLLRRISKILIINIMRNLKQKSHKDTNNPFCKKMQFLTIFQKGLIFRIE